MLSTTATEGLRDLPKPSACNNLALVIGLKAGLHKRKQQLFYILASFRYVWENVSFAQSAAIAAIAAANVGRLLID